MRFWYILQKRLDKAGKDLYIPAVWLELSLLAHTKQGHTYRVGAKI